MENGRNNLNFRGARLSIKDLCRLTLHLEKVRRSCRQETTMTDNQRITTMKPNYVTELCNRAKPNFLELS